MVTHGACNVVIEILLRIILIQYMMSFVPQSNNVDAAAL
ncbi:hypothetical protein GJA_1481 [Janthinobacterium agaricidamnosum NBRC 102515 = DSM 9628]|uniref:Uncharacterized protein n=1 Tax=Janthinobacterium agaricidamnosum NBRC 102515 = DSM 9628 TaxID=1349767 RepID=W0V4D4_9BURK|nr:hypothetical protein GJA_1481 [Janthinobacterium agaricidamnosum NBRC 102515 = DSM 9628]